MRARLCDFCNKEVKFEWKAAIMHFTQKDWRREKVFMYDIHEKCLVNIFGKIRIGFVKAELKRPVKIERI